MQSAKPLPRPPLLTPSPTPPVSRANVSNRSDAPPPSKRQRFVSPSPPQSNDSSRKPIPTSLPSTSKIPQNHNILKERHANMMRLFNAWASLAERYAKPIDEDDIVDIMTGEVVQDRGIISSWDKSKQGLFTSSRANKKKTPKFIDKAKDGKMEEWQGREKENDGDLDEIDSFTVEDTSGDVMHEFDPSIEVAKEFLQPGIDDCLAPAVDDDLEEFMEAEKRRKELYGDDFHSSGDSESRCTQLWGSRTRRKKGKERLKDTEEPTGAPAIFSALLSPAPSNISFDEDLEIYEAQIRWFRASRLTAEASSNVSESDDERCSLPCSSSRKAVPFLSQPASPEKQVRTRRRHHLRISCSSERPGVIDSGDEPLSPLERKSVSRSPIPPAIHEPSRSPPSNLRKTTTSAQNSSPRRRPSPSSISLPPSSSPLPSDDEEFEIYEVPPPVFRTPQSRRRVIIESDEEIVLTQKHCTVHPRSAPATPSRFPDDISSDDEIEIIGFNSHRPKMKGKRLKVMPSEDEDFPHSERRSSRLPTVPPSSSPVSSDLESYREHSPSFFPPTSSSPVLLPQEDESDDELVGWDLAH